MSRARVAVLKTSPETVLDDYGRLMRLADYAALPPEGPRTTLLKLNLSWTKYFPACSSEPWQVEGVVRTLLEDGYCPRAAHPRREQDRRHQSAQGRAEQPLASRSSRDTA